MKFTFDPALIKKYDKAGPRYTSYPTAPLFHEGFGPEEFAANVRLESRENPKDLSLYFHLPFCRRVCYFCACNTSFTNDRGKGDNYSVLIAREMDLVKELIGGNPVVRQLHWGGGTPTFSPPETLERLMILIRDRFTFAPDIEASVEVDPREASPGHLEVMAKHGMNRISMGIQDFNPLVQKAVNRIQPYEMTRDTILSARACGYTSVNVDLIYGLPRQTLATFEETIERVIGLSPDRVALFNFAYLPEMVKHQRVLKPEELPSPPEKLAILEMAMQAFTTAGYVFIGMDHFARPDDELAKALENRTLYRNFQGYTTRAGLDLYGFGVSAISQIGRTYSQNQKDMTGWVSALERGKLPTWRGVRLSDDDVLRRDVIFTLMCHFTVLKSEFESRYGIRFDDTFGEELKELLPMEADGLVRLSPDRIDVTPAGRLLIRNIAMPFDAYLRTGTARRYSRTV